MAPKTAEERRRDRARREQIHQLAGLPPPPRDECPGCGFEPQYTHARRLGYCILCAIADGRVAVPPKLAARGWRLHCPLGYCISAACPHNHLSVPLFASSQLAECIAMVEACQWAWEWFHPGGRGYAWGWRLFDVFHITYFARHPDLGRIPRGRHDDVWLSELPALIVETLVVEQLQLGWYRRQVAATVASFVDRAVLLERVRASVAAFDAVPSERFAQKELL